ncbi:hypothetical protein MHU86_301 [Fragilaria crotonensis]|nr:hypothetical protein MHU86_301 [Fragilaria crotonensis]
MPSKWAKRLEERLVARADTTSLDSLQTLARWVSFNRKHSKEFAALLRKTMASSPSVARSWLYWQILDQILLQDKDDPAKFDRYETLRVEIGEQVVVPCMLEISAELLLKVKPLLEVWDTVNVFGGPTLMNQIKRGAASHISSSQAKASPEVPIKQPPKLAQPPEDDDADFPMDDVSEPSPQVMSAMDDLEDPVVDLTTQLKEERRVSIVDFDFEKQGIPAGPVEAREFLDPCKAVATLQITRDLRSESSVHLRSLLTAIPKDIRKDMEAYKKQRDESGEMPELDEAKVEYYSRGLHSEILDLSVEEALDNVRSFREIVTKLKAAREKLFHLLIKSRCEFGSRQAAQAFLDIEELTEKLRKRKELILDAMDLEGVEPPDEKPEEPMKELEGFSWYNPDEPSVKRQKVQ